MATLTDISTKIVCRANYSAERMYYKNNVYSLVLFLVMWWKYRKKHFVHSFWTFSFWQCKGRPTRYELGPATWDFTCDLGGGIETWLETRPFETYLRLAFKDLRLTCDLTLATCKHLCLLRLVWCHYIICCRPCLLWSGGHLSLIRQVVV